MRISSSGDATAILQPARTAPVFFFFCAPSVNSRQPPHSIPTVPVEERQVGSIQNLFLELRRWKFQGLFVGTITKAHGLAGMSPSRAKSSHKLHPTLHESSEAEVAFSTFPLKVDGRDKMHQVNDLEEQVVKDRTWSNASRDSWPEGVKVIATGQT